MQKYFYDNSSPAAITVIVDADGDVCIITNVELYMTMDPTDQQHMINDLFAEHHALGSAQALRALRAV